MIKKPQLDKIIGTSIITKNLFDIHKPSGVFAFPSHGYVSIINPKLQKRNDIKISSSFRKVNSLKFSSTGNHLAVGEYGTNSEICILSFSDDFEKITSRKFLQTKENGIHCLEYNSECSKLISVGIDKNPYLILWDLTSYPIKIGYYKLSSIPNRVSFNSDCSLAAVAGDKLLELFQTKFKRSPNDIPTVLKLRKLNRNSYSDSCFVDVGFHGDERFNLFGLTSSGKICFFKDVSPRLDEKIVMAPLDLGCDNFTSLTVNSDNILFSNGEGLILSFCIKQFSKGSYKLHLISTFKEYESQIVTIGLSSEYLVSVYENGQITYWNNSNLLNGSGNLEELRSVFYHVGPICKLRVLSQGDQIISCGSDNTVRLWKISQQKDLISVSSHEMLHCCQFEQAEPHFKENFCGVRSCDAVGDLIVVGCNDGIIHIIGRSYLKEISSFTDALSAVTAISAVDDRNEFISGNGEGYIHAYSFELKENECGNRSCKAKEAFSSPITSIVVAGERLAVTSEEGVKFFEYPSLNEVSVYETSEPVLASTYIPKADLVATAGCDFYITLFDTKTGKLFNRFVLSNSSYPVSIAAHETGLVLAAAMSNGEVIIVDTVTFEPLFNFDPQIGIITSISFHESDIILSSFSGLMTRWILPDSFHSEIDSMKKTSPLLEILNKPQKIPQNVEEEEEGEDSLNLECMKALAGSILGGSAKLSKEMLQKYDEVKKEIEENEPINIEDAGDEARSSQAMNINIDDPRPPSDTISADSIIRKSIKRISKIKSESKDIEVLSIPKERPKGRPIKIDFEDDENPKNNKKSNKSSKKEEQNEDISIIPLNEDDIDSQEKFVIMSSDDDNDNKDAKETKDEKKEANKIKDEKESGNEKKETIKDENKEELTHDEKITNEMIETANLLEEAIEKARNLISQNFTDEEDINAQNELKAMLEGFNKNAARKREIEKKMKETSRMLIELSSQAEQLSSNAINFASSLEDKK